MSTEIKQNEKAVEEVVGKIFDKPFVKHDDILKINLLRLAADHRDNCNPRCAVTLAYIKEVAERAGLRFTAEESQFFI